jgi:hypothetical protein
MIADLFCYVMDVLLFRNLRTEPVEHRKHRRRMAERTYFTRWTPLHARIVRAGLDIQTWGPKATVEDGDPAPRGTNIPEHRVGLLDGLEFGQPSRV